MRGVFRSFCLLLAMSTSACSAPEAAMNAESSNPDSAPSTAELEAKYKRNPAPKQVYRIELKVADAPGPFGKAEGFLRYEAPDCGYMPDPIAGVIMHPTILLPVEFGKVDENTFAATIYADAMVNEDYLGKGVCHWKLMSVNSWLKATGAKTDIRYVTNLDGDEARAQEPLTTYYVKDEYPGSDPEGRSDQGNQNRSWFKPEFQNQLFTITIVAKAGTP